MDADRPHQGAYASFFSVVRQRAEEAPAAIAAIDAIPGDLCAPRQLTYEELCNIAERLAGALSAHVESQAGGVISTYMRRGNDWYTLFCAAAALFLPVVCLSTDLPDKHAERQRNSQILSEHDVRLLISGTEPLPAHLA
eukprot:2980733-Amphidinium_carterae.1